MTDAGDGERAPDAAEGESRPAGHALAVWAWGCEQALAGLLALIVVGSVLALGAVHPWAYVPLWGASAAVAGLLVMRARLQRALRECLGAGTFSLSPSRRRLLQGRSQAQGSWSFDTAATAWPQAPMLGPGSLFLGWSLLGLVWTASRPDTLRGIAFVASLLALHAAAGVLAGRGTWRRRARRLLAGLALTLGLLALIQTSIGGSRIYGLVAPLEKGQVFGPFVNRNHFAGYMLLVLPVALGLLARAFRRFSSSLGRDRSGRRFLIALQDRRGLALLLATLPPAAAATALLATRTRGAVLACFAGLAVAALLGGRRFRSVAMTGALALGLGALWFGLERSTERLGLISRDAPSRLVVWRDTWEHLGARVLLLGTGLDTFGVAISGTTPFALPQGATPWPPELADALRVRVLPGGSLWYREAHNDYLQLLAETGLPGLLLALWSALALLRHVRPDPWLLWSVTAVLLHAGVDFALQIPANSVLFVTLLAARRDGRHRSSST